MLNIKMIKLRGYDEMNFVGNEIDVLGGFSDFSNSTYISDAIQELADTHTPIYYNDILKNIPSIVEYIEQGINEFGASGNFFEMVQTGYYLYYTEVLNSNLEELMFNFIAESLNEYIKAHELSLDIDTLENDIENEICDTLYKIETFDELEELIKATIELIKNGDFNE